MNFFVLAAAVVVCVFASPSGQQAKALEEMGQFLKDPSHSNAEKQAKFDSTLAALGGDVKAKWDAAIKSTAALASALPTQSAKDAANRFMTMFKDGEFFGPEAETKAKVDQLLNSLNPEDRAALDNIEKQVKPMFDAAFASLH